MPELDRPPGPAEQIAEFYRAAIRSGELQPGDPLPPNRELAVMFKVASLTAFRAVTKLHDEGWIVRRTSKAPIVAPEQPR